MLGHAAASFGDGNKVRREAMYIVSDRRRRREKKEKVVEKKEFYKFCKLGSENEYILVRSLNDFPSEPPVVPTFGTFQGEEGYPKAVFHE